MNVVAPNYPAERSESIASDLIGIWNFLIDPKSAATRLPRRWFWIVPFLLTSAALIIYAVVQTPVLQHYLETAPAPANIDPATYAKQLQIQMAVQKFVPIISVIMFAIMSLISAALLLAVSSMMAVRVSFLKLFNLIMGCSIISALQALAWALILKMKGEISTLSDLRPPLGLDIFLGDHPNKILLGILSYFSLFQVWSLIMMILIYSVGFRVSKGKAFTAILPVLLFGLALTLLGAVFQRQ